MTIFIRVISIRTLLQTFSISKQFFRVHLFTAVTVVMISLNSCKDDGEDVRAEPTITSFTPTKGPAGTTEVTITGQNFGTTPSDNFVTIANVPAIVKTSSATAITITIPEDAVTGKISIMVNGTTATSANDFVVIAPSDFFSLTIDASYETSETGNYILASSKDGEWIAMQPFESGQTKVLNGIVPDGENFVVTFLTVEYRDGNTYFVARSMTDIPVNSTWLLKDVSQVVQTLRVKVSNYNFSLVERPFPNTLFDVSSDVGPGGGGSGSTSGTTVTYDGILWGSPADILITLYNDGFPKYVSYENVSVPTTINVDASVDPVPADRTFTIALPANNSVDFSIEAFNGDQQYPYLMCKYQNSAGNSSLKAGYKNGYQFYRTLIRYETGKKSIRSVATGTEVDETPAFPAFDFTISGPTLDNFQAVSSLDFDASTINFVYTKDKILFQWLVFQPSSGASREIKFNGKSFPKEITDTYLFIPSFDQVSFSYIDGQQYLDGKNYSDFIEWASQNGSLITDAPWKNDFRFRQRK